MQIRVDHNIKEFKKKVSLLQKDLVHEASARAINTTLKSMQKYQILLTRKYLDRPTPQTQKGFYIKFASKRYPVGSLNMKDFVAEYLQYQVDGGFRYSDKKNPVPIEGNARINQFGNITGRRRGLIKNKKQFIATIKGITAVWERVGKRGIKPIIFLTQNFAKYEKRYPFYKDNEKFVKKHFKTNLRNAFARAKRKAGV